jgi:hypothetical protein
MTPKASDRYLPLRYPVLGQLGYYVSRNYSFFHAGFCCLLAFDMPLTVRGSSYFNIPLCTNVLGVSSAFTTGATSLFFNVNLSMTLRSWTASSSIELSTVRTRLLVVRPAAAFLTA